MGTVADLHFFDAAEFVARGRERAAAYRPAAPFPHVVLDDFLPAELAERAAAEFAALSTDGWDRYEDQGNTLKLATSDEARMGPTLRHLVGQFNGHAFVAFLEALTGIEGLLPDPHLAGGGLHQLNPGGFLRVHADFNRHQVLKLDRRINALLYLNPGWHEEWGGAFELWTPDMQEQVVKLPPALNRLVIFNTTSDSFHGNPDPVTCPPGNARRSLAFYYYSNGRPEEELAPAHSTLYQTPGQRPAGAEAGEDSRGCPHARALARELVPPLVARKLRDRRG
ncbi:MAG: 2OG-Fe(II) oxygenase [Solirubrobacteraceae bacterium]